MDFRIDFTKVSQSICRKTKVCTAGFSTFGQAKFLYTHTKVLAMKFTVFTVFTVFAALSLGVIGSAHAYDPKATIADLDARLNKIGAPKLEGTVMVADKTVPALLFGDRKINNNYDVVDAIRKAHNATATVFVKMSDDFVRVSTNVLTPEGKRGVGTQLAHNKAYEAVSKGDSYCGLIDVLGTTFDACYNPIKDAGGKIIGATYIGHKK